MLPKQDSLFFALQMAEIVAIVCLGFSSISIPRRPDFTSPTPTICLPTGPALAATWNRDLLYELGSLLADECIAKGSHVLSGPCVNIARSPLGGRNHEAFGEDLMLSRVLAGYMCRSIQENGIIASPKHFLCSDQEQGCFSMNCIVTERALREIYLLPFMLAIKIGDPGAIIAAYNKINGVHVTEDRRILHDILRQEWGFRGLVMSDWHGLYATTSPIRAGLDLEMPGPIQWRGKNLAHSLLANRLSERVLDERVRAVLRMIKEAASSGIPEGTPEKPLNREQDRHLLRRAAAESIVLMKNDCKILPLDPSRPIAVIGPNASVAACRGGRIAHLRPYYTPDPIDGENWHVDIEGYLIATHSGPFDFGVSVQGTANLFVDGKLVVDNTNNQVFGKGFFRAGTVEKISTVDIIEGETYHVLVHWAGAHTSELIKNSPLTFHPGGIRIGGCAQIDIDSSIKAASQIAGQVDQVVVLAGLTGDWENEDADRINIDLPPHTDQLIESVIAANPNAVICISSGSPVMMSWVDKVSALLQVWYGGNETGNAISDVLYGDINPSGKLPISFPIHLRDNPAYLYSRAERRRLLYVEDVFVGYRFYDTMEKEVHFPFGHGLSYTEFVLSDLKLSIEGIGEQGVLTVELEVANIGDHNGSETIQVYIQPLTPSVNRPSKELKGLEKVALQKQEKKNVKVPLSVKYAFAFWDEAEDHWICE
ncbi:hypothetical protein B7463_g11026, partial [Scytalidium lignicola]